MGHHVDPGALARRAGSGREAGRPEAEAEEGAVPVELLEAPSLEEGAEVAGEEDAEDEGVLHADGFNPPAQEGGTEGADDVDQVGKLGHAPSLGSRSRLGKPGSRGRRPVFVLAAGGWQAKNWGKARANEKAARQGRLFIANGTRRPAPGIRLPW